jgi:hypothetical protein
VDVFYVICVGYVFDLLKFGFLVYDTQLSSIGLGYTQPAPTNRLMLCSEIKRFLIRDYMKPVNALYWHNVLYITLYVL